MNSAANRLYKDTIFRDLFGKEERKANALSLYNTLAGADYDDPSELELTTLDDVIYMNVKNDISFLIGSELVLWEHQSTRNPNMPLRGLIYFGRLFAKYVDTHDLDYYGTSLVKLPVPRFVVFYNGTAKAPTTERLRLSDSYEGKGDVEVSATVVNVNAESIPVELEACRTLAEYAELVRRVRENSRTMEFSNAVDTAVKSCIGDDVLAEYLRTRRAEVKDMFMTEYDEERAHRWSRERGFKEGEKEGREKGLAEGLAEGRAEGRKQGLDEGREESLLSNIRALMKNMGLGADDAMTALDVPAEERAKYVKRLGSSEK